MTEGLITTLLVNAAVFSVLFGIMLLVRRLFSKRLPAVWQYALWMVVLVKLVIPFGWESALSPMGWFATSPEPVAVMEETVTDPVAGPVPVVDPFIAPDNREAAVVPDAGIPDMPSANNETAAPPAVKRLTWAQWAMILWGAGAAVTAGWLLACLYQVRGRILRRRIPVPDPVLQVFAACKQELGIRRHISIRMQDAITVPAITGVLRPVLILPANLETGDQETLRHIILHELTHYKKGDLVMIQVMNVLNVLYWFNPLVWLCFRLMRKDMETICDQRVLGMTDRERQSGYVAMLMQFASAPRNSVLYAAMSLNDGRADMEERIRNMCRRRRMGRGMKAVAVLIAVLMLAGGILTACRPLQGTEENPAAEAWYEKNGFGPGMEADYPQPEEVTAPYTAPGTYTDEVHDADNSIDIYIDAEVTVGTEYWNVYKLMPIEIDQTHFDTMLRALIGDAVLYREDCFRSRDELENDIEVAEANVARLNEDTQRDIIDAYNGQIEFTRNLLDMPGEARIPADTRIDHANPWVLWKMNRMVDDQTPLESIAGSTGVIEGFADMEGGGLGHVTFIQSSGSLHFSVLDTPDENSRFYAMEPLPEGGLPDAGMTQDQAMAAARETVAGLGFEYLDISHIGMARVRSGEQAAENQAYYAIIFTRHIDGASVTWAKGDGSLSMEQSEELDPWHVSFSPNEVTVIAGEGGVLEVTVRAGLSAITPLAEDAEIMGFNEIMEVFKVQAPAEGDLSRYSRDSSVTADEVHVTRIELGYMPVNREDGYVLTPVWDFFGYDRVTFDPDSLGDHEPAFGVDENNQISVNLDRQSILTINAIDGSIIDRDMGF